MMKTVWEDIALPTPIRSLLERQRPETRRCCPFRHCPCSIRSSALGSPHDPSIKSAGGVGTSRSCLERYLASDDVLTPSADSYHPRQSLCPQNPTRLRLPHPRVQLHFTPTYSSWLNQVEIWFAKIEREVIARGIFTSVPNRARKLRRYINANSANAPDPVEIL